MKSDTRAYVIAEAGINHNGDVDIAKELISSAAQSGADGIKFQIWDGPELVSDEETVAEIEKWEFNRSEWKTLRDYANDEGIDFFASVFDTKSLDLLIDLDVPLIKVASGDVTNIPLLRAISEEDVPVILSTGMATMSEIAKAVETIEEGQNKLTLLHCISSYPVDVNEINLRAMDTLHNAFGKDIGYSDHTTDLTASIMAVTRGANVIEKHFTLDKTMEGPDQKLSIEPDELDELVSTIRSIEEGLGDGSVKLEPPEEESKTSMRRGLTASSLIDVGDYFSEDNVKISRPEAGISPIYYDTVIGKTASNTIKPNNPITWDDL